MRKYKFSESTPIINEKFSFLIKDYGFEIIEQKQTNYSYNLVLLKDNRKVYLYYDYKDNLFIFVLINGRDTRYPNDIDKKNIRHFHALFKKYEINLDINTLDPTEEDYITALNKNVELLKKYGDKILKGEEWI